VEIVVVVKYYCLRNTDSAYCDIASVDSLPSSGPGESHGVSPEEGRESTLERICETGSKLANERLTELWMMTVVTQHRKMM